jgi:hypothetical protein
VKVVDVGCVDAFVHDIVCLLWFVVWDSLFLPISDKEVLCLIHSGCLSGL